MNKVKRTERGWPAHCIVGHRCVFHLNTLLELGKKKIVVSTIGNYTPNAIKGETKEIGAHRYYETQAFKAKFDDPYWEINVEKNISFNSPWSIAEFNYGTDLEANNMHEKVVNEIIDKLINKEI